MIFNDATIKNQKLKYLLLNKPKNYTSSFKDSFKKNSVMSLIRGKCREEIFPIGKLDKKSTGLMLFSNDNDMVYILADSIPDVIFDEDSLCYTLVKPDSICSKYEYLTSPNYGFYSVDLKDSVLFYPDSLEYKDINLNNKKSIDIDGETDYLWRVIATNYINLPNSDSVRVVSSYKSSISLSVCL